MIPDLRFIIGAVTAALLLGLTLFGFAATVHIAQQSKVGPLEASRLLAYTSDDWHRIDSLTVARQMNALATRAEPSTAQRPEPPLELAAPQPQIVAANAPPAVEAQPATGAQPAIETQPAIEAPPGRNAPTIVEAPPAIESQPVRAAQHANEADDVDERAVVDPPLPAKLDTPAATTTPTVLHVGSIPVTSQDPEVEKLATTKRQRKAKRRSHRTLAATLLPVASTGYPLNATSVASRQPGKTLWPGDID